MRLMIFGFVVPTTEISTNLPVGEELVAWATGVLHPLRWVRLCGQPGARAEGTK
jgi:hypothetical protein